MRKHIWGSTCTTSQTSVYCTVNPHSYTPAFQLTILYSFGPNTFPAHNSVLFASEVQVEYLARTLIAPIIDRRITSLEVKLTAEYQWVNKLQSELKGTVFEAGCSNWYMNKHGRNSASWPGYASTYWKEALIPHFGVFKESYGSRLWFFNTIWRWIRTTNKETYGVLLLALAGMVSHQNVGFYRELPRLFHNLVSKIG